MAEQSTEDEATSGAGRGSSGATRWALVLALAALAGAGGYLVGRSGGEDLDAARAAGEKKGQAEGAAQGAQRGFEEGFAEGRKTGYRETYKKARRAAYERALAEGGGNPAGTASDE